MAFITAKKNTPKRKICDTPPFSVKGAIINKEINRTKSSAKPYFLKGEDFINHTSSLKAIKPSKIAIATANNPYK